MNNLQKIEWSLRFESLLDGRTFINDKTILLDETYFAVGELEAATPEQVEKANGILSIPSSVEIDLEDLVPDGNVYDVPDVIRLFSPP